jgi:ABC-type dipeptide/oligopeptide/nickel transport system permease subunit
MIAIAPLEAAGPAARPRAVVKWIWHQPLAMAGVLLVAGWCVVAITAPWITPYDPLAQNGPLLAGPTSSHVLGTDELGRDVLTRVLWGSRVSLPLACILVAGIVFIGGTLGAIAGYFGGVINFVIMRVADFVFAFPVVLLAMAVTAALGPGLRNAVLAVMCVAWPTYARVVRSLVVSHSSADYVSATRLLGASSYRALITDIAPNIAGPVVVLAALDFGRAVLLLAGLSFLGLGAQPPIAEWGSMVASGIQNMNSWWLALFPGLAMFSVVLGFTFLGDSLRDTLDPKTFRSWR